MSTHAPTGTDRLLDHTYDGIQEYDNPLPGWWVLIFWLTILLVPIYWVYYHIGIGPTVHDEYNASATAYFEKQDALMAGVEITEELLAGKTSEQALMAGMAAKFEAKCATCHGPGGRGLACPNLTDLHSIHGPELLSIHQVIRDGVEGKEMKSWLVELGPGGVMNMAAFVSTLRGIDLPGGKAPEGEPFTLEEK